MAAARPLAILLVGTALLAAMAWWRTSGPEAPPAGLGVAPEPSRASTPRPEAAPVAAHETVADAAATERTAVPAAAPSPTAPPSIVVHGTLTVVDAAGRTADAVHGSFTVGVPGPSDSTTDVLVRHFVEVPVVAGRWQLTLPQLPIEVTLDALDLGERRARFAADSCTVEAAGTPVALTARWLEFLHLRVLADDSGFELADLVVARGPDSRAGGASHPGDQGLDPVLRGGRSPLRFEPRSTSATEVYWVRAPGYAWNHIELATTVADERVLRLRPGGALDVVVQGVVPPGAVLRMREIATQSNPNDRPAAEVTADPDGSTTIEGLAAGSWLVTVEKGEWWHAAIRCGTATAEVRAGGHTTAVVVIAADVAPPPTVPVGGTLSLSPDWGADVRLSIEPGDDLAPWHLDTRVVPLAAMQPAGRGQFRWEPVPLRIGKYMVEVEGTGHRCVLDVGPATQHVSIVVPDPATVHLRVLDADTGANIVWQAPHTPGWYTAPEGWQTGWSHGAMVAAPEGHFVFRAPVGKVTIDAHPDGYGWVHRAHEVGPGTNTIEVRIARVCGVEIELRDGATVLPWPSTLTPQLRHLESGSGVAYWSANKVAAKTPGEHELTLQELDGYLPPAPQRVLIPHGQWVKVVVPLTRKP